MTAIGPVGVRASIWRGGVVASTALLIGTLGLIWLVAVPFGPEVCSLAMPGPRNCFTTERTTAGAAWTAIVCIVYIATLAVAIVGGRLRVLAIAGIVVLSLAPLASFLAVAWIPAFA
jgi:hypothetical protein